MNKEFTLINKDDEQYSLGILKKYYDQGLIAPEKKAYLTDLKNSVGPYMGMMGADGKTHFMLDAASQIATLGLGFNPGVFFGTAHFQESWLNDRWSPEVQKIRSALDQFFKRKLGWDSISTTLVNSGAEGNEVALGYCYQYRSRCHADKVLAFEGSFHGRMMVALSATWNADKRVPFEWPSKETIYCEYPDLGSDLIHQPMPNFWREVWDQATRQDFTLPMAWTTDDVVLHQELKVLMQVREQLIGGRLFAIIIEPMQCEGGDRYASDRFHTALLLMARSFKVPVVYDEVQTGFHLGREFFWHKQFNLKDLDGSELRPSYIVCAKKAQVGLVISPCQVDSKIHESYQVSSLIRGYHHAIALDQAQERIIGLENKARHFLERWQQDFPTQLANPRAMGLSFAIDLKDSSYVSAFINHRFAHGLLYYPAGTHTLRFRLNTAFTNEDLSFLFKELSHLSHFIFNGKEASLPTKAPGRNHQTAQIYQWQELMLETRLKLAKGEKITLMQIQNQLSILIAKQFEGELIRLTAENFERYRGAILDIQRLNYEPTRQTSIDKFDETARSPKGIALGFVKKGKLEGIVFAAPLKHFELERGVRNDPYYHDDSVLYMLDTTINEDYRGEGLGRFLKYALTTMAMVQGVRRLHGRNRDRLASSMMAINLSLGAYELQYIPEDYPDFEEFRDVFYYTTPTLWENLPLRLSHAIDCPLSLNDLSGQVIKEQLPLLNNKICLSNFTSQRFLEDLNDIAQLLPQDLRHVYTTSGQSEAIDKVAKSLWYTSNKTTYHMITFNGHEFGRGSFVSRSLSDPSADYFPVTHLEKPTLENMEQVLLSVEEALEEIDVLAIWIEPVLQRTMERTPEIFLLELKKIAEKYGVALVYNETASSFYRYDDENFFLSNNPDYTPTAGLCFTGGQSGIAFTQRSRFVDKPLMLISTWDGDEFSLGIFAQAVRQVQNDQALFQRDAKRFDEELSHLLSEHRVTTIELMNGTGLVMGEIPKQLTQFFLPSPLGYKICASWGEMKRFLNDLPEMEKLMDRLPWRQE
jgi:acetylornithine/succinyldiaminopimelate/putrescine aminotransferase